METKYSRTEFKDYTHRFVVQFETGEPNTSTLSLYATSDSYQNLEDFINQKKSDKVKSFNIIHRASKEQDEAAAKFINEMLDK